MSMQNIVELAPSMEGQLRNCYGRLEHSKDLEGIKQEVLNVINMLIDLMEQIQKK